MILRYLLPMIADKSCLTCHGSFETAPRFVQNVSPRGIPLTTTVQENSSAPSLFLFRCGKLYRSIDSNLFQVLAIESFILLLLLVFTGWIIHRAILKPVATVAKGIEAGGQQRKLYPADRTIRQRRDRSSGGLF
jgi:hypothetical protein